MSANSPTAGGARKPNEWQVLRQVFELLRQVNIPPGYFALSLVLSVLAALMEGIGATLLIPLLQGFFSQDYSFITDLPVLGPVITWISSGISLRDRTLFGVLIGMFVGAIFLKNMLKFVASACMTFLSTRATHHLRKQVFNAYLSFGKLYFDQSNVGHHTTVLTQFTTYAFVPIIILDKALQAALSLTVYFVVMCGISWKLTLLAIPIFLLLHVSVRKLISGIQQLSLRISGKLSELGKNVVEILSVIPLVKAMNMEDQERKHYTEVSDAYARMEFRKVLYQKALAPVQEIITMVAIILLFAGMMYLTVRDGNTMGPAFLVYFYLVMNAASKFSGITSVRADVLSMAGQVAGVAEVFESASRNRMSDGKLTFPGLQKDITFRDLRFGYDTEREILRDISFTMPKGTVTALVGPTGAGKTTIISLLLRFYDVPPNTLLLDGRDIREFTAASLRDHMALVSQETQLLHDSLRANICYGRDHIAEDELQSVVDKARLRDLIDRLPQGLDTVVGDRGVKLSGGEKQRVSIARALLKQADILILDEATSSLDSKTERLVQEAMDEAMRGRTSIVIAHRLSTVRNADMIVVIEDGRSVEIGTHEQLLSRGGKFAELWQAQAFV